MWSEVAKAALAVNLPPDVTAVWRHTKEALLTCRTNAGSTLWTLHAPDGTPIINQLEMPFDATKLSPPFSWADTELRRKGVR